MLDLKRSARVIGVLFILGTAFGFLSLNMVDILEGKDYLTKLAENQTAVILNVLSVLMMGIALSAMSVVLYPIIRRHNETLALGAVVFRGVLEMMSYLGIAVSWLMLLSLSRSVEGSSEPLTSNYQLIGDMLQDFSFQWGNNLGAIVFSLGAIIIYYVFIKTRLLPIWLSAWGLMGAVLYLAAPIIGLFGLKVEYLEYVLCVQEMIMAVWLIVKGFNNPIRMNLEKMEV